MGVHDDKSLSVSVVISRIREIFFKAAYLCLCEIPSLTPGVSLGLDVIEWLQIMSFAFDPDLDFPWPKYGVAQVFKSISLAMRLSFLTDSTALSTALALIIPIAFATCLAYVAFAVFVDLPIHHAVLKGIGIFSRIMSTIGIIPIFMQLLYPYKHSCYDPEICPLLLVGGIITAVFFTVLISLMATGTLPYSGFHHIDGRVHGRIDLVGVLSKAILATTFSITTSPIFASIIYLLVNLCSAVLMIMYNPYLNPLKSYIKGALSCINFWTAICLVIALVNDDRSNASSITIFLYGSAVLCHVSRHVIDNVERFYRSLCVAQHTSAFTVEMKCRSMLREAGVLGTSTDLPIDSQKILDKVVGVYNKALDRMNESSSVLHLMGGTIFTIFVQNPHRVIMHLNRARILSPALDTSFSIFCLQRRVEQQYTEDSNKITKELDYQDQLIFARIDIILAMQAQIQFWAALMTKRPDIGVLHKISAVISKRFSASYARCLKLSKQRGDDPQIMRIFACLQFHVLHDSEEGHELVRAADYFERVKANAKQQVNIEDFSADRAGIFIVSIAKSSLGVIRKANYTGARMVGWIHNQVIGANIKDLLPASVAVHHDEMMTEFVDSGRSDLVKQVRSVFVLNTTGHLSFFRLYLRHMVEANEPLMLACLLEDEPPRGEFRALLRCSTMRIMHVSQKWTDFFAYDRKKSQAAVFIPITAVVEDFLTREMEYRSAEGAVLRIKRSAQGPGRTSKHVNFRIRCQDLSTNGLAMLFLNADPDELYMQMSSTVPVPAPKDLELEMSKFEVSNSDGDDEVPGPIAGGYDSDEKFQTPEAEKITRSGSGIKNMSNGRGTDTGISRTLLQNARRRILKNNLTMHQGVKMLALVLICTFFLTITLALFNKFNVDLALRAFETETHYVAQAADITQMLTQVAQQAAIAVVIPMNQPIWQLMRTTIDEIDASFLDLFTKELNDPSDPAMRTFLTIRELDSITGIVHTRKINFHDSVEAWISASHRLVMLAADRRLLSMTESNTFMVVDDSNLNAIFSEITRKNSYRFTSSAATLDLLSWRIINLVLTFSITVLVAMAVTPLVVRTQFLRDHVLSFFMHFGRKRVKHLHEESVNHLDDYINPDTGLWNDLLECDQGRELFLEGNDSVDLRPVDSQLTSPADQSFRTRSGPIIRDVLKGCFIFLVCNIFSVYIFLQEGQTIENLQSARLRLYVDEEMRISLSAALLDLGKAAMGSGNISSWEADAARSIDLVQQAQHVLTYGGDIDMRLRTTNGMYDAAGVLHVPAIAISSLSDSHQQLLYGNACSLIVDSAKRMNCESVGDGLFTKGLQNGIVEWATVASRVAQEIQQMQLPRQPSAVQSIINGKDMTFLLESQHGPLLELFDQETSLMVDAMSTLILKYRQQSTGMAVSMSVGLLVYSLFVHYNLCRDLNYSIRRTQTMILNVPVTIITKVKGFKDFLLAHQDSL